MLFTSILGTKAAADDADGATMVKIAVSVKGKATYPTNKRCGYITADYGSGTSTLEVLASQNGKTLEMKLPSGSAVKFRGEAYHGWDFDGVAVTDDGIAKASLYTEEMPLYKVKQVVLLKQKGSDTFNLSITMPNMLVFNMLKQKVILFSKMIIFIWSNYQHSFYNLI